MTSMNNSIDVYTPYSSSSSCTEYKSDYDTDIDIDKAYGNKLCNIACEEDELFRLKNDFFVHYGCELFNRVVEIYKVSIGKYDMSAFDKDIWNKCLELYKTTPKEETIQCFCFHVTFNKQYDEKSIKDTYKYLLQMKNKSIKIKVWLDSVHCIHNPKKIYTL